MGTKVIKQLFFIVIADQSAPETVHYFIIVAATPSGGWRQPSHQKATCCDAEVFGVREVDS
jgi:hypothetical protein